MPCRATFSFQRQNYRLSTRFISTKSHFCFVFSPISTNFELKIPETMADNYLERQYDDYLALKARKEAARKAAFRKQLKAYQLRLAREKAAAAAEASIEPEAPSEPSHS